MTAIALVTANRVRIVESLEQATLPAAEAITAGFAVRIDTNGKFTASNGTTSTEDRVYGIAARTVAAGEALTAVRRGTMDGWDLSGLAFDAPVYLSDTDGRLDTAAGTIPVVMGRVIPVPGTALGTASDKILMVDIAVPGTGSTIIEVTCRQLANPADECFFVANRAYQVTAVKEVHATAGTDGSAVNLQVTKDTSTNAPGAGTDLLTNNTNAGFNLKGTANTVQSGTLTATTADLQLAAGDRLSIDYAGVLTNVAGVVVTVTLMAI